MSIKRLQYDALMSPVYVPLASATVSAGFFTNTPVVTFTKTVLYAALAWCPFTPTSAESITLDKWQQPIHQPVRAPSRHANLFGSRTFEAPTLPQQNLDKWQFSQPAAIPLGKQRAPHLAPTAMDASALPAQTLDRWLSYRPDILPPTKQRHPHLAPTIAEAPTLPRQTLDRWLSYRPDILPLTKQRQPHLAPSLAWNPNTPAAVTTVNSFPSSQPTVVYTKTLVFQSRFEPLRDIAPAETVTLDKWYTPPVASTPKARPRSSSFTATFEPIPQIAVPIFDCEGGDVIFTTRFQYQSRFSPLLPPTLYADQWLPSYPSILRPAKRASDYPALFRDPSVIVPQDGRFSSAFQPRALERRPSGFSVQPIIFAAPSETITLDKWQPTYPAVIARRPKAPIEFFVLADTVPTGGAIDLSDWLPVYTARPNVRPSALQFPQTFVYSPADTVALDKWLPHYPQLSRALPRALQLPQTFVYAPTDTIALNKWLPFNHQPIRARQAALQLPQAFIYAPAPIEIVTLDKWLGQLPNSIAHRKRAVEFQSLFRDPSVLVPFDWKHDRPESARPAARRTPSPHHMAPERILVPFDWSIESVRPVRPRSQPIAPSFWFVLKPEVITLDKWLSLTTSIMPIPRWKLPPQAAQMFAPVYVDGIVTASEFILRAKTRDFSFEAKERFFELRARALEGDTQAALELYVFLAKIRDFDFEA